MNLSFAKCRVGRGFTLVSTLVTIAIIALLAVVLIKGSGALGLKSGAPSRPDGKGTTVLGAAKYAAEDTACKSDLEQVRQGIQLFQSTNDDHFPESLPELKLGSNFYSCPIGHEAYQYDPATGQVRCPHPGHERY